MRCVSQDTSLCFPNDWIRGMTRLILGNRIDGWWETEIEYSMIDPGLGKTTTIVLLLFLWLRKDCRQCKLKIVDYLNDYEQKH